MIKKKNDLFLLKKYYFEIQFSYYCQRNDEMFKHSRGKINLKKKMKIPTQFYELNT